MKSMSKGVTALALLVTIGARGASAQQAAPSGDPAFVPAGAVLEKVVEGDKHGMAFTEGVAVACDGRVYYSDITGTAFNPTPKGPKAGAIWLFDPKSNENRIFRSPSGMANGNKFDANCNLVTAEGADFGGRRITYTDMKTGWSTILAGSFGGLPLNSPNDIAIAKDGRIYFTDPRYLGSEPMYQPGQAVYRIDPDLSVHQIITDIGKPNGIALCPDHKSLYVVDLNGGITDLMRLWGKPWPGGGYALWRYEMNADGTAGKRTLVKDFAPKSGPDGMTCDAEGNLWAAVRDETTTMGVAEKPGVYAFTPDGKEKAYIPTEIPTNVGFARGADSNLLYITAGNDLLRIRVGKRGWHVN